MSTAQWETISVMLAVAAACAVPGAFLLLRRVALVADAMSHVLLFGIVIAYFLVRDLDSPILLLGAAASGVLTVWLVETLQKTKQLKADAAIGLVFPALFGLGTILASMFLRNTHLDVDRVLLGSAELARESRWEINESDLGPRGTIILGIVFLLNLSFISLFFKELKLSTFDPALAAVLGFMPVFLHYALMTMVSLTAVAAFDAVGPVVVIALLVVPATAAYLLTNRLGVLIGLSVAIGLLAAFAGTVLAFRLDTNIGGTVATVLGIVFMLIFAFAPQRGMLAGVVRRRDQKRRFHETMLAIHLLQHEGTAAELEESRLDGLHKHLHWLPHEVQAVVARAVHRELVQHLGDRLILTSPGRALAQELINVRSS